MIDFKTELLPHQEQAFLKMKGIRIGALYMEQGTGKTRTTLELIKYRLDKNKINKALWLCPCSTKENLRNEIIKHTGESHEDVITICGIETLSSSVRTLENMNKFVDDNEVFIIIDESLLVKNFFAKRTSNIINLAQKCKYRIILNGTPISKNAVDLFAQWYILDWRILGYRSYYSFSANHIERDIRRKGRIIRCLNTEYLSEKISPYTFQISKEECIKLPEKKYRKAYFEMTEEQSFIYENTYEKFLPDEEIQTQVYRFFTAMSDVLAGMKVFTEKCEDDKEHIVTKPIWDNPLDNPRMKTLLDYLKDEKTIIFAKYTHEIDDIISVLEDRYGKGCAVRFDGKINLKERAENMNHFKNDDSIKYFVANKTCAGYGLNLQFCHNIIFYDNDWNLGTRLQAEDRVHRLGQTKEVDILDIVCKNTMDESIVDCLSRKENLLSEIKYHVHKNNKQDLKSILKRIAGFNQGDNMDDGENIQ